jgi:hypothetical protein
MVDTLMKTETAIEKTKRSTKVLSRVALFLGELRDGLTMVSTQTKESQHGSHHFKVIHCIS